MKILNIRFRNLNSLTGEWQIDLTHPAYAGEGLFAITGPTGAGKTTVLDAVCLALYGQTPRLGKVSKGGNEIMSRRTGDCFAEVTFETPAGRFRCTWSQHRAHKKAGGELQHPKHEIANADTGAILEEKIRDVAAHIERTTGMDFERFTRSMLLAQGNFAAFLKAEPDERAPILEQITGTEVYSEISIRVHERQRAEKAKLDLLRAETAGVAVLDAEQEQALRQSLEDTQKQEAALAAKTAGSANALLWIDTLDRLRKDIARLDDEAAALQQEREAFQPERDKLHRAHQAASLDGVHATLVATRRQQADDTAAWQEATGTLPAREAAVTQQAEAHRQAEQALLRAREEAHTAAPLLRTVRALDQKRLDLEKSVTEEEAACRADADRIAADETRRADALTRRTETAQALADVDAFLTQHAQDEWLVAGLAGIEEQVKALHERQQELGHAGKARRQAVETVKQAEQALAEARRQTALHRQAVEEATHKRQQAHEALARLLDGRLLRELRTEKENLLLKMALLAKIAELEHHRARLEDGAPCPLCGALEHPYAAGNLPSPDIPEQKVEALSRLIAQAEDQEAAIKALETAEQQARHAFVEAEKREATAGHAVQAAGKAVTHFDQALEALRTGCDALRDALAAKLAPLGITSLPEISEPSKLSEADPSPRGSGGLTSLLDTLRARRDAWQARRRARSDLEKQLAEVDSEGKRLEAVIETQGQALAHKRARLAALAGALAAVRTERATLYGDRNADDEERRLATAILNAEQAEKKARGLLEDLQQKWNEAKTRVVSLQQAIDQRAPALRAQEAGFTGALAPLGFAGEADFLAARLSPALREQGAAAARDLDDRTTALTARRKELAARLQAEAARALTDTPREELARRLGEDEDALKAVRHTLASLTYRLDENRAARERIRHKQAALDAQARECHRWDTLHQLIGSADGKKYRNFAQGLTFDLMVGHANRQLQAMNDRYLLVSDPARPLELNVIDNYQAGEVRPTKNLSGGESFLVSLALALGLSRMASRNVRVDSLFLDEGFGTLDEDALDTALETLAGLRQEGKLIGVISHVESLKDRIATQIRITPLTGGRSTLSGPGILSRPPEAAR